MTKVLRVYSRKGWQAKGGFRNTHNHTLQGATLYFLSDSFYGFSHYSFLLFFVCLFFSPFSEWKSSTAETNLLLFWASHCRGISAVKTIKRRCSRVDQDSLPGQRGLNWGPSSVSSSAKTRRQDTADKDTGRARHHVGVSLMCPGNRRQATAVWGWGRRDGVSKEEMNHKTPHRQGVRVLLWVQGQGDRQGWG